MMVCLIIHASAGELRPSVRGRGQRTLKKDGRIEAAKYPHTHTRATESAERRTEVRCVRGLLAAGGGRVARVVVLRCGEQSAVVGGGARFLGFTF